MRLTATVVALLLTTLSASAQEPVDEAMIERIRAEGLERSRVLDLYNTLTNVIGPRLTASPAHKEAADWARDRFSEWGLDDSHLEAFDFGRGWTLEKLTLEMTAPRYFPLFGYPEAWTPSTDGVVEGTPVYVGNRTVGEIRAMGSRIRGAIVLTTQPQEAFLEDDRLQPVDADESVRIGAPRSVRAPSGAPAGELLATLQELGAAAVLRPNQGEHGTIFVLGRDRGDDVVPSVVLASEHYNMLVRMTLAGRPPTLRMEVGARYHEDDTNSYNVIAEIPGTDPELRDEIVLLGAHLDSWHSATGATDNADGSAEVMEAMRILRAIGAQPRRTIRVALWGGEEQGLLGSSAYVAEHLDPETDAEARENFYIYLNDDPGAGATYGWYLEENARLKPVFDAWLAPLADLGAVKNVIERIGSTDHVTFNRAGLPGFNTIKDYVDYDVRTHHTNTDFYERLSEEDLMESAIVLAVFAWHAAIREGPLPRPAM